MTRRAWENVSRKAPCAVCGKPDYCSRSTDGAWLLCRRVQAEGSIERIDRNGGRYWLYKTSNEAPYRLSRPLSLPRTSEPILAPPAQRSAVYRALLRQLPLSQAHRHNLRQRGLSDDAIAHGGYGSLPLQGRASIARCVVEQFGPDVCAQVPGIIQRDSDHGRYWTLAGSPGLAIPVRDHERRIVAMHIRRDDPERGKYETLSSRRHGGPSPGTPAHVSLAGAGDTVRVTEGPLKANIAATLSGVKTIGLLGVGSWRQALEMLDAMTAKTVLLAFDQDWRTNPSVAEALTALTIELMRAGYKRIWLEDWHDTPEYKGIDDLLAAGLAPNLRPPSVAIGAASRAKFRPQRSFAYGH